MAIAEKFIELTTGVARYLEAGEAQPGIPVLLLHGTGLSNSAESFETLQPLLGQRHRVLAIDHLGYGKRNRTVQEGPTFDLMTDYVREFMDALHISQVHLVGHSMGGWIAALFAYQSPERVARLAMLNAAGLNRQAAPSVGSAFRVPTVEQMAAAVKKDFRDPLAATDELVLSIARTQVEVLSVPGAEHSIDPLVHLMLTPSLRSRYLLHRRLPFIRMRSLVVWGEGDGMDPYPTWTQEYSALNGDMSRSSKPWTLPDARYVCMPTGHYSHWERPQELVALLEKLFA